MNIKKLINGKFLLIIKTMNVEVVCESDQEAWQLGLEKLQAKGIDNV